MIKPVPTPAQADLITKLQREKGRSKFSRNVANFVKSRLATRVYRVSPKASAPSWERSSFEKEHRPPKGRVSDRAIYLSDRENPWSANYFHGTELSTVTTSGGSARISARAWKQKDWEVEDITDWFWARYAEIGKCLWDWEHTAYGFTAKTWVTLTDKGDERFSHIDDQTVKCRWCSDVLHLRRTVAVEVRVRHKWTHAKVQGAEKTFRCTRCHRRHPIADFHQEMRGYGPIKAEGIQQPRREEIKLTQKGMCPRCFIATTASGNDLRALLPSELLTPLKVKINT